MTMKNWHANVIVATMWGFALLFFFWTLYPYNPLEIEEPVKVLTPVVKAGDAVIVEFTFDKNTDVTPEVSLSLVDGVIYNLPTYSPSNVTGHTNNKAVNVLTIPPSMPCGEYHLHWEATYEMNPIRDVVVKYESEKFEILNSEICNE